jgi:hypothetical protein
MNYAEARQLSSGNGWHFTVKNDDRIWTHECCRTTVPATEKDVADTEWIYHGKLKVGDPISGPPHKPHGTRAEAGQCYHDWRMRKIRESVEFDDAVFGSWQGCIAIVGSNPEIDNCPTPMYHETHRYCPSCPWTEDYEGEVCDQPTKGGARYRDDHSPEAVALCPEHRSVEVVLAQARVVTGSIYS